MRTPGNQRAPCPGPCPWIRRACFWGRFQPLGTQRPLNDELESLRRKHRSEIEALQADGTRAQARLRSELAELEREVANFVVVIEDTLR